MKWRLVLSFIALFVVSVVSTNPTGQSDSGFDDKNLRAEVSPVASEHTGYPQLFTRKTTRLLSEALHMLNRVKDVKERRWLESFVHRLEILASELDKNANAEVSSNGTTQDLVAFSKSLAENTDQLKEFAVTGVQNAEKSNNLNKEVSVGVAPKASEIYRDELESQLRSQPTSEHQQIVNKMLQTNKTPKVDEHREKEQAQHRENNLKAEKIKEAEKKKILKEIYALSQKLKELGGETKSVLEVIKRSKGGVQIGTGHHFWDGAHRELSGHQKSVSGEESSTSAPSNSQLREADNLPATKTTVSLAPGSKEEQSEEEDSDESELTDSASEDNSDDLEKQLQEEKLILDSSTSKK